METVECIVVGGGLAGHSAANGLVEAGFEVMVLERGDYSGAKNVTGGRLYVKPIRGFYPELWDEAPYERPVARELVTMMAAGAHTTIEIASDRFTAGKPQSYTIVRAKLDQWLAEKVTEKGAMVVPNMKVDELLRKDGRVIGIRAGGDEIGAQVVIVAEGVLRLLSSAAGLAAEPQARHHALGYKEIIELPAGVIEDRWRLNPGEGAAQFFMGECTKGMMGGGFLYTNKESISLGMVVGMEDMRSRHEATGGTESWQLLDEFKELPQIRPLVAGGTVAEYSAHAIPEGGLSQVPKLAGDGYLVAGDTAGLSLNALVTVRGMDFAIASGYFAAEAVKRAKAAGDFSAAGLASYEASLRDSFVLKDLETARAIPGFMENPRLFTHYPKAISQLLESIYTIDERPQAGLFQKAWKGVKKDFMNVATVKDAWSMRKI
jgi:electron transfer flavoprotein-quinone oxidoreductase